MKKLIILVPLVLLQICSGFSQTSNIGFELSSAGAYTASNSISGWTLSSQTASCGTSSVWTPGSTEFSIVSTPVLSFPTIGNIGNSPLGGTKVARLNNSSGNSSRNKAAYTFSVNAFTYMMQCAIAGVWEGAASHQCCEQTGFQIVLKNSSGNVLACLNYSFSPGIGRANANSTFSTSSTTMWSNWQTKYFDLVPFVGSLITVEVISTDCAFGDHFGTLFFDATLGMVTNCVVGPCVSPLPLGSTVNYCNGSGIAQLIAPFGYVSYQWIAPMTGSVAAPQGSMATLTVTNPVANSVYSVVMHTYSGCAFVSTIAIVPTTVAIVASGSNSSCVGGASGSATVATNGSGTGYNYAWYNSTNSLVGTSYTIENLSSGIYSVVVTAAGSQSASCGIAISTITIGTNTNNFSQLLKPFCNNGDAYLCAGTGTNYQWYSNSAAISPSAGGTIPCYTITNPSNLSTMVVGFTTPFGCRDSVQYTLVSVAPGSLSLVSNPLICSGATNGSITLNMIPSSGSQPGLNFFSVISTGTTSSYSSSVNLSSSNTFTAGNLSAGGTYSVNAFDGSCKYSTTFSVTPFVFNYSLTPSGSPTLCQGNSIPAGVSFSTSPSLSQYSYSWSPTTFLIGGAGNYQNTIITPTVASGASATLIYTVVVTPSLINCPQTKTLAIVIANPQTPAITPVPDLCPDSPIYTIQTTPPGGSFISSSPALTSNGLITPTLASFGTNTFVYSQAIGTCVASASGSFFINTPPLIFISGATTLCEGLYTTLLANGASTYTWSNLVTTPFTTVNPIVTTIYSVTGTDALTNCSSMKTITVTVLPKPVLNITGDTLICEGESTTLTAGGANLYFWNTGTNTSTLSVSPSANTSYSVTGSNLPGNCTASMAVQINVTDCTGLSEVNTPVNTCQIFPNPTEGVFQIKNDELLTITILDCFGKIIMQSQFNIGNHTVDLGDTPDGIYLIKLSRGSESTFFKLIKSEK